MADEFGEVGGLVMAEGRGWDDVGLDSVPAIDRFNRMAVDNPVYGHNDILARIGEFDNSRYYSAVDNEPELDAYVQTLYLDNFGENGYSVDGDPYGEFKKGYAGPAPEAGERMYPEVAAQNAAEFIQKFGQIFAGQ